MLLGETGHENLADSYSDDIARGIQKKVCEYEKLTGDLPGVWRTSMEEKEKAETAQRNIMEMEKEKQKTDEVLRKAKVNNVRTEKIVCELEKENKELKIDLKSLTAKYALLDKEQIEMKNYVEKRESVIQVEKETKADVFQQRVAKCKDCIEKKKSDLEKAKILLKDANIKIKSLTESLEIMEEENAVLAKEVRKERLYWKARMLDHKNIDL